MNSSAPTGSHDSPTLRLVVQPKSQSFRGPHLRLTFGKKSLVRGPYVEPENQAVPDPTLKLAVQGSFINGKDNPTLRLATKGAVQSGKSNPTIMKTWPRHRPAQEILPRPPALLISYFYLRNFLIEEHKLYFRDWMIDSGAYTAYQSGEPIDLDAYIRDLHRLLANDPKLTEVVSLDSIGNAAQSLINATRMADAGLEVIPVFHIGEDFGVLAEYCRRWKKVGLSCRFGEPQVASYKWLDRCFRLHWPHKFHSFGWMTEQVVTKYPFHSADSASWQMGPTAYGNWRRFGKLSVRGSEQDLTSQVIHYLEVEERLQFIWRREMALLDEQDHKYPTYERPRRQDEEAPVSGPQD